MRFWIAIVLSVWAGLLAGVSFVATPAKFLAPTLPLAQALDVGRSTFHVLALIEWPVAVGALGAVVMVCRHPRTVIVCLALVLAILTLETAWLRPLLDARVEAIMQGQTVPPSPWHNVYIALDAARLILILTAAVAIVQSSGRSAAADQTKAS